MRTGSFKNIEMKTKIICPYCSKQSEKDVGDVNRAKKLGNPIYCSRKCSGLARRKNKTIEEKKAEKAAYDKQYRYYQREGIKEKKAAQFKKDYSENPEKYKAWRRKRYPKHLEYLQRPEYKEYKKQYDQQHRAKKLYGEFAEAAIILRELRTIVDNRQAKADQQNINKSTKRKRNATNKNAECKKPKGSIVAVYQPS